MPHNIWVLVIITVILTVMVLILVLFGCGVTALSRWS